MKEFEPLPQPNHLSWLLSQAPSQIEHINGGATQEVVSLRAGSSPSGHGRQQWTAWQSYLHIAGRGWPLWFCGATQKTHRQAHHAQHGHVRPGVLLCGGSGLRDPCPAQRGPAQEPVQRGVAPQPRPGIPAAARGGIRQRPQPGWVGPPQTLHSRPGRHDALGHGSLPQRGHRHISFT